MRVLLAVAAALITMAGALAANAAPGAVTIDGRAHGCESPTVCTDGVSNAYSEFFEAGTYEFTVASGAWTSYTYGTSTGYLSRKWLWDMFIYQDSTGMTYELGISTPYDTPSDALSNNAGATIPNITVSGPGELLTFYVFDASPHENEAPLGTPAPFDGTITANVTVVPEPLSTILFITGGVFIAGRSFMRKRLAA
jgi:hypothetical protein